MSGTTTKKIQVLDCSIRDGGLMNRWYFDPALVHDSVQAATASGIPYVELGYKAGTEFFDPKEYGTWRFCPEQTLREFWGNQAIRGQSRLSIMLDIGRFNLKDMIPASESVVSTFRVACYTHQITEAIETTKILHDQGYETFINIMAVSEADSKELEQGLGRIASQSPVRGVYVVDSYGSLNPAGVQGLVGWYRTMCPGKEIGFHGHNNQQLALANTLAAIDAGATFVDASLYGMGRGAGNCNLELILAQLGWGLPQLKPLFQVMDRHIVQLREELKWGYSLPYSLAGIGNQHPRRAMAIMEAGQGILDSGYLDELAGIPENEAAEA